MTGLNRRPSPSSGARGANRRRDRSGGGSLLELLLAAVFLEVALLAAAPLFMRAIRDVSVGAERTQAVSLAAGRLEAMPRPDAPSAPEPGTTREFYSRIGRRWLSTEPAPPDRALWVAATTLRRYPLGSIEDGSVSRAEASADAGQDPAPGPPAVRLESRDIVISRSVDGPELLTLERFEWSVD